MLLNAGHCMRELPSESVPVQIRQHMDALGVAPHTAGTAVQRRFDSCRVRHENRQAEMNKMQRRDLDETEY